MRYIKHTVNTIYTVGPVNFYAFELPSAKVMFDLGPKGQNVIDYYQKYINLNEIDAIFITHCHVDHYGLIDIIKDKTKAKIFFPKYDYLRNKNFKKVIEKTGKILSEEGFEKDTLLKIEGLIKYFEQELPNIEDGFIVEEHLLEIKDMGIDILYAPWHSQSDLIYIVGDYAISGDVLLEDIVSTPLLSVDLDNFEKRFENFKAFIETIEKMATIKDKTFLPGHKGPIIDIEKVISFQISKYVERAKRVGDDLKKKKIYNLVIENVETAMNDPYALYIKASEMFFLRDYELNKDKLIISLKNTFPRILQEINF